MSLPRLSLCVYLASSPLLHLRPEMRVWSKSPTRLCIGYYDNFASNQRLNANNKTRGPPLQAANMANLTKRVNLANNFMVNLANVANSAATSR